MNENIRELLLEVQALCNKYNISNNDFDVISSKLWEALLIRLSNVASENKRDIISTQDIFNTIKELNDLYNTPIVFNHINYVLDENNINFNNFTI